MAPVIGTWCLATFRYKKPWRSLQGIVAPLVAIPSNSQILFACHMIWSHISFDLNGIGSKKSSGEIWFLKTTHFSLRARFRLKFPLRFRCQVPQRWKQGAAGVCGLSYKMSMCLNGDCRRTIKQYHFVFAVVTLSSDSKQLIPPGCLVQLILCKPHQPSVLSHGISCKYFNAGGSSHMLSSR